MNDEIENKIKKRDQNYGKQGAVMGNFKASTIDRNELFESKRDFSARWKLPMTDDRFLGDCINLLREIIKEGDNFDRLTDEVFLLAGEENTTTYTKKNGVKGLSKKIVSLLQHQLQLPIIDTPSQSLFEEKKFNFSDSKVCELLKRKQGSMIEFLEISEHIINFYCKTKDDTLIAEFNDIARLSNKAVRLHYDEKYKFFPSDVEIFDVKLVDDVLEFLKQYPEAHQELSEALRYFLKKESHRDSVDKTRLSLELFLKEFLGNKKSLENQEKEICQHFGNNLNQHIKSMFKELMKCYTRLNNEGAKHNSDRYSNYEVEFLFYLTGVFIRLFMQTQELNKKDNVSSNSSSECRKQI